MPELNILLVDDSLSARFTLSRALEKHQLKVQTAKSAEEALQMLEAFRPSAIFMDHVLPKMDGLTAIENLRSLAHFATTPMIMCTSNDNAEYRQEAMQRGASAVLQKPPDPAALSQIVNDLLLAAPPSPPPSEPTAMDAPSPETATLAALDARIERLEQLLARVESSLAELDSKTQAVAHTVADQAGKALANRLLRAVITLKGR